ncbi:MAG: hypothetical protein AB8C84_05595 [Oligoflexales bacterium]
MLRTLVLFIFVWPISVFSQQLYLNGTDITGSTNQDLKQVDVHIDDKGHIFIAAPHYTVVEQASYLPLGEYKGKHPQHTPPSPAPMGSKNTSSPSISNHDTQPDDMPELEEEETEAANIHQQQRFDSNEEPRDQQPPQASKQS